MTASQAYALSSYAIGNGTSLEPLPDEAAATLGTAFAAIDPWKRLGFAPQRLTLFLSSRDENSARLAVTHGEEIAGFICVDRKWLCGPYLHFLGVLPGYQGRGIGSAVIDWFLQEAREAGERNAWVCVSDFNDRAKAIYAKHGFAEVAKLTDLVAVGAHEILMRKQLFLSGNPEQLAEK